MNQAIEGTLAEYFEKLNEMGFTMQLKPFGKGYRLEVGNIDIYFENEKMTYTGWGRKFEIPSQQAWDIVAKEQDEVIMKAMSEGIDIVPRPNVPDNTVYGIDEKKFKIKPTTNSKEESE